MSRVRIRKARPEEAELIREIENDAAERYRGSQHAYVVDHDAAPAEAYAELAAEGLVFVAELDGIAAGFAASEAFPDALHLHELAVRHARQGQGLGRRLVEATAKEARRRGLPAVTLTTFADIDWNAPLYAHLGFRELDGASLNEWLRQKLEDEYGRGLTERCAMRLAL